MPAHTETHLHTIRRLAAEIGRPVQLMEVCGTHTMAISRAGLRSLLPPSIRLLSGPGCPVCVTPVAYVDKAVALAKLPDTTVATFGDMIRVPGTEVSLERARAEGAREALAGLRGGKIELAGRPVLFDVDGGLARARHVETRAQPSKNETK